MKILLTALLVSCAVSVTGQGYAFPNIGESDAQQIRTAIDSLFAGIRRGYIAPESISGKHKALTCETLEYFRDRLGEDELHEIINCYPLRSEEYRVMVACTHATGLRQLLTFDVRPGESHATVDLPLWQDTRNWSSCRVGTIHYFYDHDFDRHAADEFDQTNRRIARKLGLPVDSFDFYLSDNYQQIMHWMGLAYDSVSAGQTRNGFDVGQTIFAICHNEDFSHDLVHYYVYKIRKGPRNPFAEEGVAYYWGNAYYTDSAGRMVPLLRLKTDLRGYIAKHPEADWLTLFRKNQRGVFGPAKEVSVRSTLSGIVAEYLENKYGVEGVLALLNCGAGEDNYFKITAKLAGLDASNFNQRIVELAQP
jgi:hypothetical protein